MRRLFHLKSIIHFPARECTKYVLLWDSSQNENYPTNQCLHSSFADVIFIKREVVFHTNFSHFTFECKRRPVWWICAPSIFALRYHLWVEQTICLSELWVHSGCKLALYNICQMSLYLKVTLNKHYILNEMLKPTKV